MTLDITGGLVLGLLAGLYLLINLALPLLPGAFVGTYVIPAILWGLLAWAILVLFLNTKPPPIAD